MTLARLFPLRIHSQPRSGPSPWPALAAAWLQSWIWVPIISLYLVFVPLLLPEGHLPSPRWRPVAGWAIFATLLFVVAVAFQPGRLTNFYPVVNPLGAALAPELALNIQSVVMLALSGAMAAAALSLFWRLRHASAQVRQQLKWVALAFALGVLGILTSIIVSSLSAL